MYTLFRFAFAFAFLTPTLWAHAALEQTTETYTGGLYEGWNSSSPPVLLRIANGGAGQSGLVRALADAYIQESVKNGSSPFRVAWILSDTTSSIKHLQDGSADVAITYCSAAEKMAIAQDIATKRLYLFRDHFLIVGPIGNPAKLSSSQDVYSIMESVFRSAESKNTTSLPTRWLSRYDKSATNIKESQLWLGIGQVPWASAYSTWYHQYIAFPLQALTAAIQLEEYTLTDRGTYLSLPAFQPKQARIYKQGIDDESDPLLNPGHLLVGRKAQNVALAYHFADWATSCNGQKVITSFKKNGQQLYSGAP